MDTDIDNDNINKFFVTFYNGVISHAKTNRIYHHSLSEVEQKAFTISLKKHGLIRKKLQELFPDCEVKMYYSNNQIYTISLLWD